ncbi:MAG: hypothetical protein JWN03_883 [Nocardia sp.]|uniref:hypothetical protein n=1 Tax=Nocardia sp. TaxID=1821 RepID=UPI00261982AD|nr:hypothetical protein [Nocardia sp.]MCU1640608.1 hypothetical protein [Nocardia sp.]
MSDDAAQDKKNNDEAAEAVAVTPGGDADTGKVDAEKSAATPETDTAATTDLTKKAEPEEAEAEKAEPAAPAAPAAAATTPAVDATKLEDSPKAEKPKGSGLPGGSLAVPVLALIAAGVVLIAAVAAGVVFWLKADDRKTELSERDSATATACDFGTTVTNYDAAHLDDYFTNVKNLSTGDFAKMFNSTTDGLRDAMVSVKVKSTLNEIHCGWVSGDSDKAKVMVVLTQNRTSQLAAQPDSLTIGAIAEMEKDGGKWKVANFDNLPSQGNDAKNPLIPGGGDPNSAQPTTPGASAAPGAPAPAAPTTPAAPK